mgnify:CR=1 FL=1
MEDSPGSEVCLPSMVKPRRVTSPTTGPTTAAASQANAYLGPYAASKAALETLARAWAQETASTPLRVNLFNHGPTRTRIRAIVFPGEDPATLQTPNQVAEWIVPMCAPAWTETGRLYDYPTRTLQSFRAPG